MKFYIGVSSCDLRFKVILFGIVIFWPQQIGQKRNFIKNPSHNWEKIDFLKENFQINGDEIATKPYYRNLMHRERVIASWKNLVQEPGCKKK